MKRINGILEKPIPLQPAPPLLSTACLPRRIGEIKFRPPRAFLGNRFVYAVISQRGRGLSIGVNMNPDKFCNFDCAYCEVNRNIPPGDRTVDLAVLAAELENLLLLVCQAKLRELPY